MREIERPAYAKLNLTLEILGRRPDGYHEVCSILQALELHDSLHARAAPNLSLSIEAEEDVDGPQLSAEDNLVLKAARALRAQSGIREGASLHLVKRIPVAAGLGGGSSDAAAALLGLNELWMLGWGREQLAGLAATLGADVSFFLAPGAALASGRGDLLQPLPALPPTWAVLVTPTVSLPNKTWWAYSQLAPHRWSSGALTLDLAARLRSEHPSLSGLHLYNAFESVVVERVPAVAYCRQQMWSAGARGINLSGAGPTLFALLDHKPEAAALASRLRGRLGGLAQVALTRTLGRLP